ncbi:peptidoglycan-binding protein [Streptomyces sp. NPDC097941]|uniref:peptidoglycan-binding protein n=1 Tax=Streptomyces sp. NPDC097941 TaxID=3155685 RepID=UPI00332FC233
MPRWKALPQELDPRVRQLVVRLRRLKDHSGLSMRQVAARTAYSPKSWERYLGGRSLPPQDAVEAMARIGGDDPTRLLALHEVAAEAWTDGRDRPAPAPEMTAAEPETGPEVLSAGTENTRFTRRSPRIALVAGTVALVVAVSSAVLLAIRLEGGDSKAAADPRVPSAAAGASSSQPEPTYTCRLKRIDGRWYAGNSRTQDAVLGVRDGGPEVAEAQCLMRRAGISPGGIDGIFGPLTEQAVKEVQKRADLIVDGVIGPHTWKALRK